MSKQNKYHQAAVELINTMMSLHGFNYEYIINNQEIEGVPWYQYYTWTENEEKEFREWATEFLRKKFKWSKKNAEKELAWFMLNYGLKRSDYGDSVSTDDK